MAADTARIVQLTDTHFSAVAGVPMQWPATVEWLRAAPPDLIVHSGDVVREDPDDAADLQFARRLLSDLPAPLRCIPGNHDVGFYGEDDERERRLATFRAAWGADRFIADLAGWRIVGADAYLLGIADHDDWLRWATRTEAPLMVFIHQPLTGDEADGWEMPADARLAFDAAVDGADVRVIASGHRHVCAQLGRAVWAPSLTLTGDAGSDRDPRPGFVEHLLTPEHTWRVVRPWETAS